MRECEFGEIRAYFIAQGLVKGNFISQFFFFSGRPLDDYKVELLLTDVELGGH